MKHQISGNRMFKSVARYAVIGAVAASVFYSGWVLSMRGIERTEGVMRYARMIDTEANHSVSKGHHTYNTRGYFVDRETGLRFGDSIGDSLYRQFAEGGNQGIEVSWHYSIDKREQTSKGTFYILFGSLMCAFAILTFSFFTFAVAYDFYRYRKGLI